MIGRLYVVVVKKRTGATLEGSHQADVVDARDEAEAVEIALEGDFGYADGTYETWAMPLEDVPSPGIARRTTEVSITIASAR